VPQLCRWRRTSRSTTWKTCAGGIFSILGSLARGGLLHTDLPTVHSRSMEEAIAKWDITQTATKPCTFFKPARPASTQTAFSQSTRWETLDDDREKAASAASSTPTRRKAAWPCCTATSPWTAAW
jgi:dihydroxy-acid dehydratase